MRLELYNPDKNDISSSVFCNSNHTPSTPCVKFVFADTEHEIDCCVFVSRAGLQSLGSNLVGTRGMLCDKDSIPQACLQIFKTELVTHSGVTQLIAHALLEKYTSDPFMLASTRMKILGAIKRGMEFELSMVPGILESHCSICGGSLRECSHVPAYEYDQAICSQIIDNMECYKWQIAPALPSWRSIDEYESITGHKAPFLCERFGVYPDELFAVWGADSIFRISEDASIHLSRPDESAINYLWRVIERPDIFVRRIPRLSWEEKRALKILQRILATPIDVLEKGRNGILYITTRDGKKSPIDKKYKDWFPSLELGGYLPV